MAGGNSFFPMPKGEKLALVFLIVFSGQAFLPVWRASEVAGMVLFGWIMAALMVVSPILTLWVFRRGRRRE